MKNKDLLIEIKQKLFQEFPGIIDKVILFGSQIKGKATEDSDYDILVVVNIDYDWEFKTKIYDTIYDLDLKYDILIDVKIISLNELKTIKGYQPFIIEAFEQGIVA